MRSMHWQLAPTDRELNELKYDRPMAWFDYLNRIVKLGCPTVEEIERFAEMKAARDLLIHNSGIVNFRYVPLNATGFRLPRMRSNPTWIGPHGLSPPRIAPH